MFYHYLSFMLNIFRLKYTNTSSGEIRVPNEGYQLNITVRDVENQTRFHLEEHRRILAKNNKYGIL